jgi:L-ascorbate metabolism protein UlaG (beta-lactamase superfamily)
MFAYKGIQIAWLGHDGFRIRQAKVVYIDPYKLSGSPEPGDVVLITHEHFDHLSPDDLQRVVTPDTTVVTIPLAADGVKPLRPKALRLVRPGDRLEVEGIRIEAVAAYNLTKFRSPGNPFHPRPDGKVGFILGIDGVRIYHAGDTDQIPEMTAAKGVDVALLPVSGTYVMTAGEAVEACRLIQPAVAIPMHYGSIVGSAADAETFRSQAPCAVEVLQPEG